MLISTPVCVYAGNHCTLQADINLHVVTGATVKFSSVPADCLKEGLTLTRFEPVCPRWQGLARFDPR